jgi:single-stranded-DNA-specific exonuclease
MSPEERFLASIEEAVKLYRKHVERGDPVRIVSHSDADGIAAGGILSLTAFRSGVPFKTTCEVRLDDEILKGISEEGFPLVIFSDIGSSYLDMVGRHLSSSDVIILDHHPPIEVEEGGVVHINPVLHGLDGSRE